MIQKTKNYKKNLSEGFTLVEVMVALALALILFFFAYRFIMFTISYMEHWYRDKSVFQQNTIIYNRIQRDLTNQYFAFETDSLKLIFMNEDTLPPAYSIINHELYHNSKNLTLDSTRVDSMNIFLTFKSLKSDSLFENSLASFTKYDSLLESKAFKYLVLKNINVELFLFNEKAYQLNINHTIIPESFIPLHRNYDITRLVPDYE